jgi:hypothetical protein
MNKQDADTQLTEYNDKNCNISISTYSDYINGERGKTILKSLEGLSYLEAKILLQSALNIIRFDWGCHPRSESAQPLE